MRDTFLDVDIDLISAALWVGYTDDSETPEMIMKKFEALEKIQQQQRDKDTTVSEEQTEETSNEQKVAAELDQDQVDYLSILSFLPSKIR